jgi:hypothetical protein
VDVQQIGPDREYFNAGTWTRRFEKGTPAFGGDDSFVFVQGTRVEGGLEMKLMEWHDPTGEPRMLKLFDAGGAELPPPASGSGSRGATSERVAARATATAEAPR